MNKSILSSLLVYFLGLGLIGLTVPNASAQEISEVPYFEDFSDVEIPEDGFGEDFPEGWETIGTVQTSDFSDEIEGNSIRFPNPADDPVAITPEIHSDIDLTELTFFFDAHYATDGDEGDIIAVGYMADHEDPDSFTAIDTITLNREATTYSYDLDDHEEEYGRRLAFIAESGGAWNSHYVGNVGLAGPAPEYETIAELVDNALDGFEYNYTGEAIVTYIDRDSRNQHYIADETGAILIDDAGDVLGDDFSIGDGLENFTAEFNTFGATRQLVLEENPGVSSEENELPVFEVELADLDTYGHQSMLVEVDDASFPNGGVFENNANYDVVDPSLGDTATAVFTTFSLADDLDYFGLAVPRESLELRAIVTEHQGNPQLTARSQEDFIGIELTEVFTVYYNNPEEWDDVYAYAWEDDGDHYIDWPGELMNEPEEGSDWYSYNIPTNFDMVIFNNDDGEQTDDLERNTDGWFDGEQWHDEEPVVADVEVASIAELLEVGEPDDGVVYTVTEEVYLTFNSTFRNRKAVVDPSGGIIFDDSNGNMSTEYDRYDGITGITGTLGEFNNLIQFEPVEDAEITSSNNQIFPRRLAVAEVDSMHQGELVLLENVTFQDSGTFEDQTDYTIEDADGNELTMRTDRVDDAENGGDAIFYEGEETIIGTQIPEDPVDLIGYVGVFFDEQIVVRKLDDIIDPTVLGDFNLQFPENEDTLVVEGAGAEEIPILWEDSDSEADVTYQWMIQMDGLNYTPPHLTFPGDNDGTESQVTLTREMLDEALQGVGLEEGEMITLNWTVMASEADGNARRYAQEDFTVTLERGEVTSSEIELEVPEQVSLNQNYPNPFNPTTTIEFQLPSTTDVQLTVYNTLGQQVATLVNEQVQAGSHEVTFDGSNLASGVYIYRLQADGQVITNQMTLVK